MKKTTYLYLVDQVAGVRNIVPVKRFSGGHRGFLVGRSPNDPLDS